MGTNVTNLNTNPWRGTDAAGKGLKPLTPADLGQPAEASALKPLTFADYVVGSKDVQKTPHDQLVETTQKWVSQTFYGTILKQMHESPFRSEVFDGGRGGHVILTADSNLATHQAILLCHHFGPADATREQKGACAWRMIELFAR